MRLSHLIVVVAVLGLLANSHLTLLPRIDLVAHSSDVAVAPVTRSVPDQPGKVKVLETYGKLPLSFEANQGQNDEQVKFLSRGSGYILVLISTEAARNWGKQ